MRITRQQAESLFRKWEHASGGISYLQFRRGIVPVYGTDSAFCIQWCGMWVCIEPDGYCHT